MTRWLFARLAKDTGITIVFDHFEGSVLSGRFIFKGLRASRPEHQLNVFDFKAGSVELDISLNSLLKGRTVFERLHIQGLEGFWEQKSYSRNKLIPKKPFTINELSLTGADLSFRYSLRYSPLSKPMQFNLRLDQLQVESIESEWFLSALILRSQVKGAYQGAPFELAREHRDDENPVTVWRWSDVPIEAMASLLGGPFEWFDRGRLDLVIGNRSGKDNGIEMLWSLMLSEFHVSLPSGLPAATRLMMAPIAAHMNAKNDRLDLSFYLALKGTDLRYSTSEDLKEMLAGPITEYFKEAARGFGRKAEDWKRRRLQKSEARKAKKDARKAKEEAEMKNGADNNNEEEGN